LSDTLSEPDRRGSLAMNLPLTTFEGTMKCHRPENLSDIGKQLFDYFFPHFLWLHEFHSDDLKGIVTANTAELSGRGRERRFAGDMSLDRGRYHALQNPKRAPGRYNPLICEMFAYADPGAAVQPSVFDSTIEDDREDLNKLGITAPGAYLAFVIVEDEVSKIPIAGLPQQNQVIRAPIESVQAKIARVIDLRLPATQEWFFDTFYHLELARRRMEGPLLLLDDDVSVALHDRKLTSFFDLLPTLVAPNIGGGLHFIQGIGAWLRSHEVFGLVFPSARTDFGVDMLNGTLVESWGWNFVLYHNSPPTPWEHYFGKCLRWLHWEEPVRLQIETASPCRAGTWAVRNLRTFHEQKYQRAVTRQRRLSEE
jgi:hypothetical protein